MEIRKEIANRFPQEGEEEGPCLEVIIEFACNYCLPRPAAACDLLLLSCLGRGAGRCPYAWTGQRALSHSVRTCTQPHESPPRVLTQSDGRGMPALCCPGHEPRSQVICTALGGQFWADTNLQNGCPARASIFSFLAQKEIFQIVYFPKCLWTYILYLPKPLVQSKSV